MNNYDGYTNELKKRNAQKFRNSQNFKIFVNKRFKTIRSAAF